MAHFSVVLAAIAGVSYAVFCIIDHFVTAARIAAKARELGCQEPVVERTPGWLPLGINNVRVAIQADKEQLFPRWMQTRAEELGTYTWVINLFGSRIISTHEPQNIQAILATQFGTFDLGPQRRGLFWPMLGNGIFTQSSTAWKHSRDMMRPQFTREQVSDLDLEERHVQNLMRAIDAQLLRAAAAEKKHSSADAAAPPRKDGWSPTVDLQDLFFRLTLDSATEFLLGESADSQLEHVPGASPKPIDALRGGGAEFATAFDRGQMAIATRARFGPMYWLYNSAELRAATKTCNRFMDHYVRRALDKDRLLVQQQAGADGHSDKTKPRYVFLDALAEQTQDPIELRSQLLHILLAGRDTTASMLGWLFLSLARDPARYKKLRDIVLAEFGTYDAPRDITFARLKSCQYLQHCNNEALRLYPVVPINARYAYKDTTLPVGGGPDGKAPVFVSKGSPVEYCVYVLHRRKDLWGPDADEFVPERWENRKVGWEYVPFNGGPRICLGQQFALTEASYVTVRLLQRFEAMENRETDKVIRHNLTLTTCSGNGVKVGLKMAKA